MLASPYTAPPLAPAGPASRLGRALSAVRPANWSEDERNIVRKFGFLLVLGAIFLRISNLHELLSYNYGILYVLYLFAPPALIAALLSGGVRRIFSAKPGVFWVLFTVWLLLTIPFSSWKAGSLDLVISFLKTELPFLLIFGGVLLTWREYKMAMYTIVLAVGVVLWTSTAFLDTSYGRAAVEFGTIGNANDLAAHLIFTMPFLYFVLTAPKIFFPMRLLAITFICGSVYYILGSASRGAFISLVALAVVAVLRASMKQKIAMVVVAPILLIVGLSMVPKSTFARIFSIFGDSVVASIGDVSVDEAEQSKEKRIYLLKKSLEFTFRRPLFGVGPGNFATFEGGESRQAGLRGTWNQTHNVYTQISSECGLPALFLYVAAMVTTYRLANRTYKQARGRKDGEEIAAAALSLMMCVIAFGLCITFLTIGYRFYLLGLAGFATVLYNLAQAKFAEPAAAPVLPSRPAPPRGMAFQPVLKKQQVP
jgi:O-antigen ligase